LRDFAVFAFHPGPSQGPARRRRPTVAAFLIHPHGVEALEPVPLERLEDAAIALFERSRRLDEAIPAESFDPAALAWATHLLYRKPDEPSLFVAARECPDPAALARQACGCFSQPTAESPENKMPLDSETQPGQQSSKLGTSEISPQESRDD
jgi:hypothetical protein